MKKKFLNISIIICMVILVISIFTPNVYAKESLKEKADKVVANVNKGLDGVSKEDLKEWLEILEKQINQLEKEQLADLNSGLGPAGSPSAEKISANQLKYETLKAPYNKAKNKINNKKDDDKKPTEKEMKKYNTDEIIGYINKYGTDNLSAEVKQAWEKTINNTNWRKSTKGRFNCFH